MRKLTWFMHVSLDGFVQGEQEWDLGWIKIDEEVKQDANETFFRNFDTVLWGRHTYLEMYRVWPNIHHYPDTTEHDIRYAAWINKTKKVVFSTTLENVEWDNTTLIKENTIEEVQKLKNQDGGDVIIIGSPGLAQSFIQHNLIDEFRLNVNPIILGNGLPLFKNIQSRIPLELIESKTLRSGVVGLVYRLKKEPS